MNLLRFSSLLIALSVSVFITACGDGTEKPDTSGEVSNNNGANNGGNSNILKVGDKLFNLPSPLETAFLIEEVGGHFTEALLNPDVDANKVYH